MNNSVIHIKNYIVSQQDIPQVAQELYEHRDHIAIYTFEGSLGAGKTTLVQKMLSLWGVVDVAPSPTFSYVNIYTINQGGIFYTLYHFDLYRLNALESFFQQGFEEYLYQPNSWVFIEWPEIVESLLTNHVCRVKLAHYSLDMREVSYCCSVIE